MKFVSVRLIAQNIKDVVQFYELVTRSKADWLAPVFAEIVTPVAVIAIGSVETVALFRWPNSVNHYSDEQETANAKICVYSNANFTETLTIRPSEQCKYTRTFEEE
jgi:hypothetical protein